MKYNVIIIVVKRINRCLDTQIIKTGTLVYFKTLESQSYHEISLTGLIIISKE